MVSSQQAAAGVTRVMRTTKPTFFPLKNGATSRLKIGLLSMVDEGQNAFGTELWVCSVLRKPILMDPLCITNGILREFKVVKIISKYPTLVLQLEPGVVAAVRAEEEKRAHGSAAVPAEPSPDQASAAHVGVPARQMGAPLGGFTERDVGCTHEPHCYNYVRSSCI